MRDASVARKDLKPLTSLRFVAALMVFVDHAPATRPLAERYELGEFGVTFFFLLSGFILMVNYHNQFTAGIALIALRRFYVSRFARVYPMQVLTTVIAVVALALWGDAPHNDFGNLWTGVGATERLEKVMAAVLLLQPWTPSPPIVFGVNPPAWSIADEAFFYALFPLAAWYATTAFRAFGPAVVLGAAGLIWVTFVLTFTHASAGSWFFYYFPPVRFIDFFIGMLLGLAHVKWNELVSRRFPTVLEAASLIGASIGVVLIPLVPGQLRFALWMTPFAAFLISIFAYQAGSISQWMSKSPLIALGEASFAFYLVHGIVLNCMNVTFGDNATIALPSFAITVALSFGLFHWFETPMRAQIRGR
jgi:peptidoglycan/LPS O-acetylase OafA/YrhL